MKKLIAISGLALFASTAFAADDGQHWFVAPKIGGAITDDDRHIDNGLLYGLAVGKHLNDKWSVELNALNSSHSGKSAADLDLTAISADVLRVFNRNGRVAPYLTAGIGALRDDPSPGKSNDDFMAQVGGGLLIRAWQNSNGSHALNIRPEAKLRWDDTGRTGRMTDLLVGVAFEFGFGAPTTHIAAAAAMPAPAPAPVVAAPVAAPAPMPVAAAPKILDSDGDGVLDDKDQCPNTPRGTAVDAMGCPRKGSITLVGVHFENNSAKLKTESFAVLNPVATDLKAHSRLKVEVQGHTDSVGSDKYNQKLSQSRSEAVREYLITQGVGADQLTAKGYGETKPVADNKTQEGRAQNRRVAMDVIDNPGDVQVKQSDSAR